MDNHRIILTQSEYETLLKDIKTLRERVVMLTALRDDLVYHICPSLQSEYEEKIASLERELLASQLYLLEMERILEILQAQLNQGQNPSMEEAEKKAKKEYREYQEDLNKKAKEAEDSRRWKEKSNWYEYDDGYRNRQEDSYEQGPEGSEGGKSKGNKGGRTRGGSEDKDRDGDDRKDSGDGRDSQSDGKDSSGQGKSSTIAELKKLYRKIVKLLHPDVHPDPTPREKELLNQAIQAYDRGDLEAMQKIWQELTGSGAVLEEETFEDSPEGIAKMREILKKLKKRCRELDEEIRQIRSAFPYTMKDFLENEEAVEKKRSQMQGQIDRTREMNRQLEERIKELKKQMGKSL